MDILMNMRIGLQLKLRWATYDHKIDYCQHLVLVDLWVGQGLTPII